MQYLQYTFLQGATDECSYLWRMNTVLVNVFFCRSLSWVSSLKSCQLRRIMWRLRTASCMWRDSCTRCHQDLGERKVHRAYSYPFKVINISHLVLLSSSGVFRTIPPFSHPIIQSVLKEILISKGKEEDESVHAFVSRRLGSEVRTSIEAQWPVKWSISSLCCPTCFTATENQSQMCRDRRESETNSTHLIVSLSTQMADIAIDSLCRGVFAGDCRKLSVRSCFPPLYKAEQSRGSIVLGMLMGSGERFRCKPSVYVLCIFFFLSFHNATMQCINSCAA